MKPGLRLLEAGARLSLYPSKSLHPSKKLHPSAVTGKESLPLAPTGMPRSASLGNQQALGSS
jgi:hypothetical protein